jgi:hypothetical protein
LGPFTEKFMPSTTGEEKLYPFTVSNLSLGSSGPLPWCSQAHLPTSAPFRAQPPGRHPAGYPAAVRLEQRHPRPGFPLPFGAPASACWASPPAGGVPPLLRSAYRVSTTARTPTGFPRFAHARHDRGGCPLYPEASGVPTTDPHYPVAACRLFQRPGPITLVSIPSSRARNNEASTGIHLRSPVRSSPRPLLPRTETGALRLLPWASHPHGQDPQTHARAGIDLEH